VTVFWASRRRMLPDRTCLLEADRTFPAVAAPIPVEHSTAGLSAAGYMDFEAAEVEVVVAADGTLVAVGATATAFERRNCRRTCLLHPGWLRNWDRKLPLVHHNNRRISVPPYLENHNWDILLFAAYQYTPGFIFHLPVFS
jgi:hypothetical protein